MKFIIYMILSTAGMSLIKYGGGISFNIVKSSLNFTAALPALLGAVCYILSFLLWINLLRQKDLSYIFPVSSSLSIVISSIVGFIMGEAIGRKKLIGLILIIIGVIFMG